MTSINTMPNTAKMIQVKSYGDWACEPFVCEAMCKYITMGLAPICAKASIAVRFVCASPKPTGAKVGTILRNWAVQIDLCKKAAFGCRIPLHRKLTPFVVTPSAVYAARGLLRDTDIVSERRH